MRSATAVPSFLSALLLALAASAPAFAEETAVTVRVLSRDAKLIGSSMGGARVNEVLFYAFHPDTGNTGFDRTTFIAQSPP